MIVRTLLRQTPEYKEHDASDTNPVEDYQRKRYPRTVLRTTGSRAYLDSPEGITKC